MKRVILWLFVVFLAFGMVGCKEPTVDTTSSNGETNVQSQETEQSKLCGLQNEIASNNKLLGIAYLGWFENDAEWAKEELFKQDYINDIPFVKDIVKYAEYEGYKMYAIVPVDDGVTISVCKCEFDDEYKYYGGEELICTNEPFIVRGNIGDNIPNLYVIAKNGSEIVEYPLLHSGMDGKLANDEGEYYDFTPYSSMPEFDREESTDNEKVATDPSLLDGEWKMISGETDGYQFTAEEEGIDSGITINVAVDVTAKYYSSTEFKNDRFEAELEYMDEVLYQGCGNDVWKVKMVLYSGNFNDEDEFYATLIDENTLLLQHIFPFDGARGVSYCTYVRK